MRTLWVGAAVLCSVLLAGRAGATCGSGLSRCPSGGTTCTAASAAVSDVDTAITQAKTCSGHIRVSVPPTTSAALWNSRLVITLSGMTATSLHLQGAGDTTPRTEIVHDHSASADGKCRHAGDELIHLALAAGKAFTLSGFLFNGSQRCTDNNEPYRTLLVAGGGNSGLRVTGNSFTHTYKNYAVFMNKGYGLIDSNRFHNGKPLILGAGSSAWAAATELQGANFLFIEDNTFTRTIYGNVVDANAAGRYVFRHNDVTFGYPENHAYRTVPWSPGWEYGSRAWQIYNNTFKTGPSANPWLMYLLSGTGVAFNNTWTHSEGGSYTNPSNGMAIYLRAACDAARLCPAHPCPGQIGRGHNQAAEPAYEWNNRLNGSPVHFVPYGCANSIAFQQANRDYYNGASSMQDSNSSPFDGTVGTGFGTIANRPTSCTPGVAYWATDQGHWNSTTARADGVLYKCLGTADTWTPHYRPYPYPHPTRGGAASR